MTEYSYEVDTLPEQVKFREISEHLPDIIDQYPELLAKDTHHVVQFPNKETEGSPEHETASAVAYTLLALEAQMSFQETLEDYPNIKRILTQANDGQIPSLHVGIDSPKAGTDQHLAVSVANLGRRSGLVIIGDCLLAKEMAKGFVKGTRRNIRPTGSLTKPPEVMISTEDESRSPLYLDYFEKAGLIAHLSDDPKREITYYNIQIPENTLIDSIIEKLKKTSGVWVTRPLTILQAAGDELLLINTDGSTVIAIDLPGYSTIMTSPYVNEGAKMLNQFLGKFTDRPNILRPKNQQKLFDDHPEALTKFAPIYVINGTFEEVQSRQEVKQQSGDAAFYFIDFLADLKNQLELTPFSNDIQSLLDNRLKTGSVILEILARTSAFTSSYISQHLEKYGWDIKETEHDANFTLKLIALNDVYQPNLITDTSKGHQFDPVINSLHLLNKSDFKKDLTSFLATSYQKSFPPVKLSQFTTNLTQILNKVRLHTRVGISSCLSDSVNWIIPDSPPSTNPHSDSKQIPSSQYQGGDTVRGNLITLAGRLVSRRHPLSIKKTDTEALSKLDQLYQGDYVVMQKSVAERYNLFDPYNPEHLDLGPVRTKGFPQPISVVVIGIHS